MNAEPRDPGTLLRPTRRLGSLVSVTAALALIVAACGGAASPIPSTAASAEPASPSPAASPAGSPDASPAGSPAASSGVIGETGTVEIAGEGFRITLPEGWQAIEMSQESIAAIGDMFPADSDIGQLLQSQAGSLALAGVKLFAIDSRPGSVVDGFAPNLNVLVQPRPAGLSIELLATVAQQQLSAIDAFSGVTVDSVDLPAGPAIKATYAVSQTRTDGSTVEARGTQYYLASDDSLFIVTMTGAPAGGPSGTFDEMADSIEID